MTTLGLIKSNQVGKPDPIDINWPPLSQSLCEENAKILTNGILAICNIHQLGRIMRINEQGLNNENYELRQRGNGQWTMLGVMRV